MCGRGASTCYPHVDARQCATAAMTCSTLCIGFSGSPLSSPKVSNHRRSEHNETFRKVRRPSMVGVTRMTAAKDTRRLQTSNFMTTSSAHFSCPRTCAAWKQTPHRKFMPEHAVIIGDRRHTNITKQDATMTVVRFSVCLGHRGHNRSRQGHRTSRHGMSSSYRVSMGKKGRRSLL